MSAGSRLCAWNTTATFPGLSSDRGPSAGQASWPELGSSSPARRCSKLDLPLPEGPMIAMRSPGLTMQLASATAVTCRIPSPKMRDRWLASIIGSAAGDRAIAKLDDAVGAVR